MNSTTQISKSLNPLDHTRLKGTIPHTEKSAPSAKRTKHKSSLRGENASTAVDSEFSNVLTASDLTTIHKKGFKRVTQ